MHFSIIVSYRDREVERVKRALDSLASQSFTNFELIFVDYGSKPEYTDPIKRLVQSYPFTKYVYSETRGWFWNRAHALNTGVQLSCGEVILFFDIDLMLELAFLQKLQELDFEKAFYTFSCFYLPQSFDYTSASLERDGMHYEQNYVGLCAISRSKLVQIKGFDEYFMVWGVEDDDLYNRLAVSGLQRKHMAATDYLVFHQWHPTEAPKVPTAWYIAMVDYMTAKKYKGYSNKEKWGQYLVATDRSLLPCNHHEQFDLTIQTNSLSGFLLFNTLIESLYNPTINSVYFSFETLSADNKNTDKRTLLERVLIKKPILQTGIEVKEVYNFLQHFVGTNRNRFVDYYVECDNLRCVFMFKK